MINVIVASTNPSKVKAVKLAFETFKQGELNIISVDLESYRKVLTTSTLNVSANIYYMETESGVSSKPIDEEVEQGILNRLDNLENLCSQSKIHYDYLIAIEGGYLKEENRFYICTSVGVRNIDQVNKFGSSKVEITKTMFEYVKKGYSLNKKIEDINNIEHNKQENGVIGDLTDGIIPRAIFDSEVVKYALVPHLYKDNYQKIDNAIMKEKIK